MAVSLQEISDALAQAEPAEEITGQNLAFVLNIEGKILNTPVDALIARAFEPSRFSLQTEGNFADLQPFKVKVTCQIAAGWTAQNYQPGNLEIALSESSCASVEWQGDWEGGVAEILVTPAFAPIQGILFLRVLDHDLNIEGSIQLV